MVMLQEGAGGKDSATLLRDILQKEKQLGGQQHNNNNAGEHTEDSGTENKPPTPLQSPPSSNQSDVAGEEEEDEEDEDEREIREARESIEMNESHSEKDDLPAELKAVSGPLSPTPEGLTGGGGVGGSAPAGSISANGGAPTNINVNGCKKRKLYQPSRQTAVENGGGGESLVINDDNDEEGLDDDVVPVKRSEDRESLRARLREQYEQLNGDGAHLGGGSAGLERNADLERLVAVLKSEITHTLTQVIDNIVSRFVPRLTHPDHSLLPPDIVSNNSSSGKLELRAGSTSNHHHLATGATSGVPHHHQHHTLSSQQATLQSLSRHDLQSSLRDRTSSPPSTISAAAAASLGLRGPNPPSTFDLSRPESFLALTSGSASALVSQRDLFAQMLDRKAKSKVIDRGGRTPRNELQNITASSKPMFANVLASVKTSTPNVSPGSAVVATSLPSLKRSDTPPYGDGDQSPPPASGGTGSSGGAEQTEAMSLVVTPGKKKRHKVTDTRLAPRRSDSPKGFSLGGSGGGSGAGGDSPASSLLPASLSAMSAAYPPPLIPVSLPTSVAIPNPSLHHELFLSQLEHQQRLSAPFSSASAATGGNHPAEASSAGSELRATPEPRATPTTPAVVQPPTTPNLPPAGQCATASSQRSVSQLTAASSPADAFGLYLQRAGLNKSHQDTPSVSDRDTLSEGANEPASTTAAQLPTPYDVMNIFKYFNSTATTSALSALGGNSGPFCPRTTTPGGGSHEGSATPASETSSYSKNGSLGGSGYTSTLTPMHLRKAKLMFFYVRYPSSAILKMYFPDINFNKNNTAQLVKWFSNFREFYYIQMEKYARQAISEGVRNAEDIRVSHDSELLRVLNLHYNRNNHIDVPENFRFVVEQTLREFFKSILAGKDQEQSWKKAIYKIIARLDDNVPEYFKSPNFLEQLE
ncbi:homeobox protein prospero-like [Varroa jacobsoni]|nr:homeobox protein prospero-like [Varroa jacobsoni]